MERRDGHVSRETEARLQGFAELLERWNRSVNLISRDDRKLIWSRHIADSLQLAPLIPLDVDRAIDLGSGAGFPGLVLAIATGISFDLIESDHRKASFLREAGRVTNAPVRIHAIRIEAAKLASARLVTARALAPLPELISFAAPLLAADGVALFPKGPRAERELTGASRQWHMTIKRIPSQTAPGSVIYRISELSRVTLAV